MAENREDVLCNEKGADGLETNQFTHCNILLDFFMFQIQTLVIRSLSNALVLPWPNLADSEQVCNIFFLNVNSYFYFSGFF